MFIISPTEDLEPPVLQSFCSQDEQQLPGLPTYYCSETDERYLLWSDVQQAFEGVIYLTDSSLEGALFMIDNDGELRHPLCIKYYEYSEYIPVCRRPQMYRQTESEDPKQGSDHVPTVTVVPDDTETLGNMMELALRDLDDLLKGCRGKNQFLELRTNVDRRYYQMTAASSRYFSSMLVEEMERLDMDGTAVLADGKNKVQILEELHGFEQQAHEWDHRNICWNMLAETDNSWDFATSRLFIVLPSDLNSWNDSDPSTHQFRLCFLCDNNNTVSYSEESPRHVHLSDHPGYTLKRPQEFFQTYGYYMLRILLMIKHGFSSAEYDIPSLDTFKILWNCNPDVSGSHLTKETLGRLVDKAVAHLQVLSLPKRKAQLALTRKESAAIKTYLDMQDGDNAQGSLHRFFAFGQRVYWRCQAHSPQNLQAQQLKELKEFVCSIGGDVDMRQAKLHVDLHSAVEAHRFRTLLQGAKHIFDISLKFCWPATQSVVQELGHGIGKTGTVALEIEGLSPDIYPGSYMQPLSHFFYSRVPSYVWLKYVTLLNYPRPQEQCIRIGSLSLRSTLTPERTGFDWIALSSDFDKVRELLSKAKEPHDCDIATKELRLVLERHGFPDATVATIYATYWIAAFDLEQAAFVEAYSTNMSCPNAVLSSGSLRKLAVHIHDEEDESWFFDVVQSNNFLQELKLTHFRDVIAYIEGVVRKWGAGANTFTLTLFDRLEEPQFTQVAQLTIRGCGKDLSGGSICEIRNTSGNRPSIPQPGQNIPVEIEFLQWECDHISTPVSDYLASILDMATYQHPSVLSLFVLDISQLSSIGLAAVQRILGRSSLEYLSIICGSFDSSMSDTIAQALGAIQWDTLKYLVLSGDCIDEWLQLWPSTTAPRLLCLEIQVSKSANQPLSHLSVLFIHRAIYASPLLELRLGSTQLEDERDWVLILDCLDPIMMTTLERPNSTTPCS